MSWNDKRAVYEETFNADVVAPLRKQIEALELALARSKDETAVYRLQVSEMHRLIHMTNRNSLYQ